MLHSRLASKVKDKPVCKENPPYFSFSNSVYLQMARDTEGALGKTKGKEREPKLEKVVKKDRPGMI